MADKTQTIRDISRTYAINRTHFVFAYFGVRVGYESLSEFD